MGHMPQGGMRRPTAAAAVLLLLLLLLCIGAHAVEQDACLPSEAHPSAGCAAANLAASVGGGSRAAPQAGAAGGSSQQTGRICEYQDEVHAEGMEGIEIGEHGYKYRIVDGLMVPPYVTPTRYNASRTVVTRPTDVCYCSFPKSGSTWLATVLYLLLNDGVEPEGRPLRSNLHWMESSWTYPRTQAEVDALPSPRIFKSHMPHRMALAGGPRNSPCKHIYIARNPKDVAVSYYHFESGKAWSGRYNGTWEHWLRIFTEGRVQRGDWFEHVLSWWEQRDAPNLLFLKYEDLKSDFRGQLRRIAAYLQVQLSAEAEERIVSATTFAHMRAAGFSNHKHIADFEGFFRKGEIGSWKDRFTMAQSEAFDKLCRQRMAGSGLEFDFE
ncbi:hypothetical protein COHA_005062 [Chlorella ohadii]|uniref:Sulfotransferase n=1 Tax=Chlorella ohadii TaxID=2649997 RepID=A0AAD5DVV1_9CHLO|nr:hypothetical protein COHA_005062 [Chlorella ohadii]